MPRIVYALVAVLAPIVLICGACGSGSAETHLVVDATTASSTEASTTTSSTTTEAASTTDATLTTVSTAQWGGEFSWVEFVEGDPGSDQTLGHTLTLDPDGEELSGRFVQLGFQTFVEADVVARSNADGGIDVVVVNAEPARYEPGELLFSLSGDPAAPLTTIGSMITLRIDLDPTGTYFRPGTDD